MGTMTGCNLDVVPPSNISAESFWQNDKDAWYGLNACYSDLEGVDIWDEMCTDNSHSHKPWEGNFELVQQNGISAGTGAGYGNYSFGIIRKVNNFILNVDRCNMDEALKNRMKAEARFFRAFSYLDLTTKFGKVPIVIDVLEYDAPNVPRDEVSKVREFILSELAEIATILPERYSGGYLNETGRVTRYAALALRARAALYFGDFSEAEKSAKEVIDKGGYSLFKISELTDAQLKEAAEMDAYIDYEEKGLDRDKFLKGMFSYESLWHNQYAVPTNPEYILTREYMDDANNYDWTRYTYFIPKSLSVYDGYCSYEPMQDLIDAYWDADGKTLRTVSVEQRKTNYEKMWADFTDVKNDQAAYFEKVKSTDLMSYDYMAEFRNRDSRLYASMLFPFKGWHETIKGEFYFMFDPDKINKDGNESWSGYAYRKLVTLDPYDRWASSGDYPVIRYAEVLLTYAEAHIQNSGWDQEVVNALNMLRDRCGMPNVPNSISSKDEALSFVRNERRIELAAEGHRYDDIRRYGNEYCSKVMNGPTYAPNGYVLINKVWDERLMLMPIPQNAIDVNPLLKNDQNPGY